MLSSFFSVILRALAWMGSKAFTGATGAAMGQAFTAGLMVFVARLGVSVVSFTVIYAATSAMTMLVVNNIGASPALALMQETGVITGINILLSTLQAIISIRVMKVGFAKLGAA